MSSCSAIPAKTGQLPEAERLTERGFVEMAYAMDLPLVATNDVYFPEIRDVRGA
jgi:DNA polymerase-3 subunit alpha